MEATKSGHKQRKNARLGLETQGQFIVLRADARNLSRTPAVPKIFMSGQEYPAASISTDSSRVCPTLRNRILLPSLGFVPAHVASTADLHIPFATYHTTVPYLEKYVR